jgi:hypothetical protein
VALMVEKEKESESTNKSSEKRQESFDDSKFKSTLVDIIKYGATTRVFSIAIKQSESGYDFLMSHKKEIEKGRLDSIKISCDFIEKNIATGLFPPDERRAQWEIEATEGYYDKDRDTPKQSILNFDLEEKGFDDLLYRLYSRKIASLSLEKSETLYFAKVKTIRNIKAKLSNSTQFLPLDIGIYIMLKRKDSIRKSFFNKKESLTANVFSPIITICAILTPSKELEPQKKVEAFIDVSFEGVDEENMYIIKENESYIANLKTLKHS